MLAAFALGWGGLGLGYAGWGCGAEASAAVEPRWRAAASAVDLRWHAPSGCPSAARVRARLEQALGARTEPLRVEAELSRDAAGAYHAEVWLEGPWGSTQRRLDSPTCETLAEAVVLLAVVSVGSVDATIPTVPEVEVEVEPEPDAEPEPSDPSQAVLPGDAPPLIEPSEAGDAAAPEVDDVSRLQPDEPSEPAAPASGDRSEGPRGDLRRSPEPSPVLRGIVRLAARAGGGVLPRGDFGLALAAGVALRRARFELLGAGGLPRTEPVLADVDVRFDLVAGELRGCGVLPIGERLEGLPCAGLELGAMRGRGQGSGLRTELTSWQPWVAAAATGALLVRLAPRVHVWLGGSLVVPLRRPGFRLVGGDEVHRVAPIAGRGALGLELRFP